MQVEDAGPEYEPVLHTLHVIGDEAPSAVDAVPAGQSMHMVPSLLE